SVALPIAGRTGFRSDRARAGCKGRRKTSPDWPKATAFAKATSCQASSRRPAGETAGLPLAPAGSATQPNLYKKPFHSAKNKCYPLLQTPFPVR
ncbi:MAG: hypothetical protein ACRC6G_01525, partial [Deefgea sp.]